MKCPRQRFPRPRKCLIALGILLTPPTFWAIFLALVPTDCARQKIAERLSQASGRNVSVEGVCVGLFGGVYVTNLDIGAPHSTTDPWLHVGRAAINVSLFQLLLGHVDPTQIDIDGLALRVLRRHDGSIELADLLKNPTNATSDSEAAPAAKCEPSGLSISVHDASILIVDERSQTRLEFTQVAGTGLCQGCFSSVKELRGTFNGAPFEFVGQLDRSAPEPMFEGEIRIQNASLGDGMGVLGYLVPVFTGMPARLDGKLALDLYLRGQGTMRSSLLKSIVGNGQITLDPVLLDGSQLLSEIGNVLEIPQQGRVGSVHADLSIKDAKVATDNLTLNIARAPILLQGWTDFDGRINYKLATDRLTEKLPQKAKAYLAELAIDVNEVADLKVVGTTDAVNVTVDGVPLRAQGAGSTKRRDGHDRLREIGHRIRDRIHR